tara:strand:+ start:418 stop:696 length:279 start_codon:yes stop_codon:yes gene_type:complete
MTEFGVILAGITGSIFWLMFAFTAFDENSTGRDVCKLLALFCFVGSIIYLVSMSHKTGGSLGNNTTTREYKPWKPTHAAGIPLERFNKNKEK